MKYRTWLVSLDSFSAYGGCFVVYATRYDSPGEIASLDCCMSLLFHIIWDQCLVGHTS